MGKSKTPFTGRSLEELPAKELAENVASGKSAMPRKTPFTSKTVNAKIDSAMQIIDHQKHSQHKP